MYGGKGTYSSRWSYSITESRVRWITLISISRRVNVTNGSTFNSTCRMGSNQNLRKGLVGRLKILLKEKKTEKCSWTRILMPLKAIASKASKKVVFFFNFLIYKNSLLLLSTMFLWYCQGELSFSYFVWIKEVMFWGKNKNGFICCTFFISFFHFTPSNQVIYKIDCNVRTWKQFKVPFLEIKFVTM